jgi:Nidogen-like
VLPAHNKNKLDLLLRCSRDSGHIYIFTPAIDICYPLLCIVFALQQVNTFQAVLVSDGFVTFVILNYNKLTWTSGTRSVGTNGVMNTPATVTNFVYKVRGYIYYQFKHSSKHGKSGTSTLLSLQVLGRYIFTGRNSQFYVILQFKNCKMLNANFCSSLLVNIVLQKLSEQKTCCEVNNETEALSPHNYGVKQ